MKDTVPKDTVAKLCKQFGCILKLQDTRDDEGKPLDGAQLLWAIAGVESGWGANCGPRLEPAYWTGKYSKDQIQAELNFIHGKDGASSLGPWQIMAVHAYRSGFKPAELRTDAERACLATVGFLNREILGRQHARTLEEIGDAYNSGNFKDANKVPEYVAKLRHNYYSEVLG